jgi:hypothetical protein
MKRSLSDIPRAFVPKLQPLHKYWEKFDKQQQLQVFESSGSLFYREISNITYQRPLNWDEFVSYCWQYHSIYLRIVPDDGYNQVGDYP